MAIPAETEWHFMIELLSVTLAHDRNNSAAVRITR
jgi:hypothetical protein